MSPAFRSVISALAPASRLCVAIVACVVSLVVVSSSLAQCDRWMSPLLSDTQIGADGPIYAAVSYNSPQGNGTPWIVVGGDFTHIGGRAISKIAAWDGSTWREIGASHALSGIDFPVHALAVFNGRLIAGGDFTRAGNTLVNSIAQWNGFTWEAMGPGLSSTAGSLAGSVKALQVFNNELVAGGTFNRAGTLVANRIAKWNGSAWSALGTGVSYTDFDSDTVVTSLTIYNSQLAVGGFFSVAGGVPAFYAAHWNGSAWGAYGGGAIINGGVQALCVSGTFLYAGGGYSGVHPAIQRWNGSSWSGLGSGVDGTVYALAPHLGGVLVGGSFGSAGGISSNQIARWTAGDAWNAFPPGMNANGTVLCLQSAGGPIIIGGNFTQTAGGETLNHVAIVNGSTFFPFHELAQSVSAMTSFGGKVYAAGSFYVPTLTDTPDLRNIASFDGLAVTNLASGTNGPITALKAFTSGTIGNQRTNVVAGGAFSEAGGVSVVNIANWVSGFTIPPTQWVAMGAGLNGSVNAIERFNNITYAAGAFSQSGATPVARIAQFDGTNWLAVGSGLNGTAYALKVFNSQLYAGGSFTTAGGTTTGGLARWNGSVWTNVGGTFGGTVYALEVFNNELIIGGAYPGITGNPNIARYNGSSYSTLGVGGTNDAVRAITANGAKVYIGGDFNIAGGISATHLARWSSASGWESIPSSPDNPVRALASLQGEVHVGAASTSAARLPVWNRYTTNGIPWLVRQPIFGRACFHSNATTSVVPAIGYSISSYLWRHNGVPLALGATGTGSFVTSANATLTLSNVYSADAGSYTCTISNSCGGTSSNPATLSVCIADFNCDNSVDFFDYLDFVDAFAGFQLAADFNQDGVIDFFDYLDFVDAFSAGC